MGPFDRFNDRAKRVLALAQDEAIRFNHNYIGTEHLLLGLVREADGAAAGPMARQGSSSSTGRPAGLSSSGRAKRRPPPGSFTPSRAPGRATDPPPAQAATVGRA